MKPKRRKAQRHRRGSQRVRQVPRKRGVTHQERSEIIRVDVTVPKSPLRRMEREVIGQDDERTVWRDHTQSTAKGIAVEDERGPVDHPGDEEASDARNLCRPVKSLKERTDRDEGKPSGTTQHVADPKKNEIDDQ